MKPAPNYERQRDNGRAVEGQAEAGRRNQLFTNPEDFPRELVPFLRGEEPSLGDFDHRVEGRKNFSMFPYSLNEWNIECAFPGGLDAR